MKANIILLVFIFGISCSPFSRQSHEEKQTETIIEISPLVEDKMLDTSRISSVQFIPLETRQGVVVEGIDEIEVGENRIYILDRKQESIFIFDKSGNYINRISKKGRGPDEYNYIVDFGVYENTNGIEIYDHRRLILYDMNGKFLSSKSVPFFAGSFVKTENGYVFFADNHCNEQFCDNLIFCDNELNITSTALPVKDNFRNIKYSEGRRLLRIGGVIKLVTYDDFIYTLSSSSIINKEKPVFEGSTTPKVFYEQKFTSLNDFVIKSLSNPNTGFINNYKENDSYTYFRMYKKGSSYNYIYNKHTGSEISYRGIESELFFREVLDLYNNELYSYLSAITLIEKIQSLSELNQFDQKLLKANETKLFNVKETDNPIIMIYKVD